MTMITLYGVIGWERVKKADRTLGMLVRTSKYLSMRTRKLLSYDFITIIKTIKDDVGP